MDGFVFQKSVSVKNKLVSKFSNSNESIPKEQDHIKNKNHSNLLSTVIKKSKQAFYYNYSKISWNRVQNRWKAIKPIVSLKTVASIAETTKNNIEYSHKFNSNLKNICNSIKLLQTTNK